MELRKRRASTVAPPKEAEESPAVNWTDLDKLNFAQALRIYGIHNCKSISEWMGNKTESQVTSHITCRMNVAATDSDSTKTKTSLDGIIDTVNGLGERPVLENDTDALSETLRLYADYGKIPPPEECGGVDYCAIYKYIATLCDREPAADLDPRSSAALLTALSDLDDYMTKPEVAGIRKRLEDWSTHVPEKMITKHYGKKKNQDELREVLKLNKLNVPLNDLKLTAKDIK